MSVHWSYTLMLIPLHFETVGGILYIELYLRSLEAIFVVCM